MKLHFLATALLSSIAMTCLADLDSSKVFISGTTNKSALSYKAGEEMEYTFKAELGDQSADGLFLKWSRNGDDGVKDGGTAPANQPLVVKTKIDKPGFVSVNVYLVDKEGKNIKQEYLDWAKKKQSRNVGYYAGTAVDPESLTDCGEPGDFDAFWTKQKARLAAVPFKDKVELKKLNTINNADIYAVSIPCAGPRPATGYLNVPVNAKEKSLPAIISFHGYGTSIHNPPGWGNPNALTLNINAHGQELGRDAAYYKEFFESIKSNGKSYAFDPEQNADPEQAFFNGMVFRVLRAMEYLKSRPEWNGKDLTAEGGSQGGLQTMWAAALDQDVTVAKPSITWCCDLAGTTKKGRYFGGWRIPYVPAIDYYDPVFMAKRIKTARVEITRAGLGDYTCPPSGLAISYKNIASPKKSIRWVQGSDHGFVPEKSEVIVWTTEEKKK